MEALDKTKVKELLQEMEETLKPLCEKRKLRVNFKSVTFRGFSVDAKCEIGFVDDSGDVMHTESELAYLNHFAKTKGVTFKGDFINSVWIDNSGQIFKVVDCNRRSRKYSFGIEQDGKLYATGAATFLTAKQITAPTRKGFRIWCELDPDDDCVRESDVEIYDEVQMYFENVLLEETYTEFSTLFNEMVDKDVLNKNIDRLYDMFGTSGISETIEYMKLLLK